MSYYVVLSDGSTLWLPTKQQAIGLINVYHKLKIDPPIDYFEVEEDECPY